MAIDAAFSRANDRTRSDLLPCTITAQVSRRCRSQPHESDQWEKTPPSQQTRDAITTTQGGGVVSRSPDGARVEDPGTSTTAPAPQTRPALDGTRQHQTARRRDTATLGGPGHMHVSYIVYRNEEDGMLWLWIEMPRDSQGNESPIVCSGKVYGARCFML